MFLWAVIVVGGSGLLIAGIIVTWYRGQAALDAKRITYRLTFPAGLDLDKVALLLSSLTGITKAPVKVPTVQLRPPHGENTLVLEILSTPQELCYLLSFAPELEATVSGHLRGLLPTMGFEQVMSETALSWSVGVELSARRVHEPNPELVPALLSGLRQLGGNQAAICQFVFRPVHYSVSDLDESAFYVLGRLAVRGDYIEAKQSLKHLLNSYRSLQVFSTSLLGTDGLRDVSNRATPYLWPSMVSARALAVSCGLPPVPTAGLKLGGRKLLPPDHVVPEIGLPIAKSNFPGTDRILAFNPEDLAKHVDIVGKTGVGKSVLMANLAVEEMDQGYGVGIIDPHGDLIESILARIPRHRHEDVILFEPARTNYAVGFNIFQGSEAPDVIADQVMAIFKGIYNDSGIYTSNYLRGAIQALASVPGMTLVDLEPFFNDASFRARIISQVEDVFIREMWLRFDRQKPAEQRQQVQPSIHRIQPLLMRPSVRLALGQSENQLDLTMVLKEKKILLVSLPENLGRETAELFGSLFFSRLWSAAQSMAKGERQLFFLHMDEAQKFMNMPQSLDVVLDEARKFKLGLTLAHPGVARLPASMRFAINASTRTKVAFQLSSDDARLVAPEFGSVTVEDLTSLQKREIILKTVNNDETSSAVSGKTLDEGKPTSNPDVLRTRNERIWGRAASEIDKEIMGRQQAKGGGSRPTIGQEEDE